MTFTPIEPIQPHYIHDIAHDHNLSMIHKRKNPFSTVAGVNLELIQLARINPGIYDMVRKNPAIIRLLNENPKLLQQLIKDPVSLQRFLLNPSDFLSKLNSAKEIKSDNKKNKTTATEKLDSLVKSKQRKQEALSLEKITTNKLRSKEIVDPKPHRLGSEIIAKAHVENPNTQRSVGEFRYVNRSELVKSGALPHDQELQPDLITTARAFALNPNLLKMMSAEAIALSRTKKLSASGNPDDDYYEIENETEEASSKEEIIEEVNRISESEAINKVSVGLK